MARPRQVLCGALAVMAVGAVGAGWLAEVPDITAAEAVTATEDAFDAAGLTAEVASPAFADVYVSPSQETVAVWRVQAVVRTAPVEVVLAQAGAQPVRIDDLTSGGTAYVLSELEYNEVASGVEDPALDRIVERNVVLTLAAGAIVAMALALAFLPHPQEPR